MKTSRFRVLRVMKGKSQVEVAREAGITQAFVSLIETKKVNRNETERKIAKIYICI